LLFFINIYGSAANVKSGKYGFACLRQPVKGLNRFDSFFFNQFNFIAFEEFAQRYWLERRMSKKFGKI
jgi:hypothetical protein